MYESKFKQASKESSKEDNQTHSVNNLFLTEKELKSYKQLNVHEVDGKGSTFSQRYMFNVLKILRIDDNGYSYKGIYGDSRNCICNVEWQNGRCKQGII